MEVIKNSQSEPAAGKSKSQSRFKFVQLFLDHPLLAAVIIGCLVRFIAWDQKEFWLDEIYRTFHTAGNTFPCLKSDHLYRGSELRNLLYPPQGLTLNQVIVATKTDGPQYQPLYYVIAFLWQKYVTAAPMNLRLLSVVISFSQVPTIYYLSKTVFRDRTTSQIAAWLTALCPFCLLYSQDVSEYALLFSMLSISVALLYKYLSDRRISSLVLFISAGSLSCLLSAHSALMLLGLYFYSIWRLRSSIKLLSIITLANLIFLVVMTPWLISMKDGYQQFAITQKWLTTAVPTRELARYWFGNLAEILFDTGYYDPFGPNASPITNAFSSVCLFLESICLLSFLRRPNKIKLLIFAMMTGHILFFCGQDLFLGGIRSKATRYMIPLVVAGIMIISSELRQLMRGGFPYRRRLLYLSAACLICFELSSIGLYYSSSTWNHKTIKNQSLIATAAVMDKSRDPSLFVTDWSEGTNSFQMIGVANYARPNHLYLLTDSVPVMDKDISPPQPVYLFNVAFDFYLAARKLYRWQELKGLNYLTLLKSAERIHALPDKGKTPDIDSSVLVDHKKEDATSAETSKRDKEAQQGKQD